MLFQMLKYISFKNFTFAGKCHIFYVNMLLLQEMARDRHYRTSFLLVKFRAKNRLHMGGFLLYIPRPLHRLHG